MLEKADQAIKNGLSRDTSNIWYTRHRTNKTQKTKKMSNTSGEKI
jgi:hypothetical protein